MTDVVLETGRLRLRRFNSGDAASIFQLHNDPLVMRYINGGIPASREEIDAETLPLFMRDRADLLPGFWAAEDRESRRFLGWLSLRPEAANPLYLSLGYRFHQSVWGRGYATEGARALLALGFGDYGVQRVQATTYQDNLASRRVLEKLGMRCVRRFRYTQEELRNQDTATGSTELWDGVDLEYVLNRADASFDDR